MTYQGRERFFVSKNGALTALGPTTYLTHESIDINDAGVMLYDDKLHYTDGSTVSLPAGMRGERLNNVGEVAGSYRTGKATPLTLAAEYRLGGMTLSGFRQIMACNYAHDINDFGVMAGVSEMFGGSSFATRYLQGEMQVLESTTRYAGAFAVNNSGFAVGYTDLHAALWTPDGALVDLGAMLAAVYGPTVQSMALAINSFGEVVGMYAFESGTDSGSFLYSNGVMYDLDSLIGSEDWVTTLAYDINDRHQIIADTSYYHGSQGILLNLADPTPGQAVAEPATSALLPAGLAVIAWCMRRRKRPAHPEACQSG
jgi:probable HAF family extracellular repeat protein